MQARPLPFYAHAPFWFTLLLAAALVGFFPSYYGRLGDASLTHHFHGATSTCWMLLLIGQAYLVRRRQLRWHRAIGRASIVLAIMFVISGGMIVRWMLTDPNPFSRMFGPRLAFLDVTSVLFFLFAYVMAIVHRKDMQLHARYMASTALPLLPPALGRVYGIFVLPAGSSFDLALHLAFLTAELVVVALLVDDWRKGKIRAPYLILLATLIVQQASFEVPPASAPWQPVVAWISAS